MSRDSEKDFGRRRSHDRDGFEKREKRRNIRRLQCAITEGDLSTVEEILKEDFDVDFQYNAQTSLQLAVRLGRTEICSRLISKGADVNTNDADGNSLLYIACLKGHEDTAKLLVDSGADVNSQNMTGNTPLKICAFKDDLKMAQILLNAKCDLNSQNTAGETALYCAAEAGNVDMVQLLLQAGADPDWGNHYLRTPLMAAILEGHENVVDALLEGGANIDEKNRDGVTAVYEAACHGRDSMLKKLVQRKPSLDCSNVRGNTPLLEAIHKHHAGLAKTLIGAGCDVNLTDRLCLSPLHAAIRAVSGLFNPDDQGTAMREVVVALVDAGAELNKNDLENWTPLYLAASCGDLEMCKFLLDRNASIHNVTKYGSTVLHAAVYGGNPKILELLIAAGCPVNRVDNEGCHALLAAVSSRCSIQMIKLLLDAGSDINIAKRKTNNTALHEAVDQHFENAAFLLIDKGSSTTAVNAEKKTPLYLACQRGLTELIEYMLRKTGCPTSGPHVSTQPIHAAAFYGRASAIDVLAKYGCDLDVMNEKGETPIMTAVAEDNFASARSLLQLGCDLNFQNKVKLPQICCFLHEDNHPHLGLEPLFLAMTHKNMEMMAMLLRCYGHLPYQVIRMCEVLLARTQGINRHYTPEQKKEIFSLFGKYTRAPFTLADGCRRVIRASMKSPLQEKVQHLPVGEKVKDYILMKDDFGEWQELESFMPGGSTGFCDIFVKRDRI